MARTNPYIGPKAFQRDDAYLFVVVTMKSEAAQPPDLEQIILLHAPSGASKTSLINKAVIPKLEEKNFLVMPVMRVSRLLRQTSSNRSRSRTVMCSAPYWRWKSSGKTALKLTS